MRIISKENDYYDYFQNVYHAYDDSLVYDRRKLYSDEELSVLKNDMKVAWRDKYALRLPLFEQRRIGRNIDERFSVDYGLVCFCGKLYTIYKIIVTKGSLNPIVDVYYIFPDGKSVYDARKAFKTKYGSDPFDDYYRTPFKFYGYKDSDDFWDRYNNHEMTIDLYETPSLIATSAILSSIGNFKVDALLKYTNFQTLFSPEQAYQNVAMYVAECKNVEKDGDILTDKEKSASHGFFKKSFKHR